MRDLTLSYVRFNKHTVNLAGCPPLCCTDIFCAVYQKLNISLTTLSQLFAFLHEKLVLVLNKVHRRHKRLYYHLFLNFGQLELNVRRTYLVSTEIMVTKLGQETSYISRDISWIYSYSRLFRSMSIW